MHLHAWLSFINVMWFFFYFSSITRETKWSSCGTLSLRRGTQLFIPRFWAFFRSAQQSVFSLMGITHLTISRYTFYIRFAYCAIVGRKNNKINALSAFYCLFLTSILTSLLQWVSTKRRIIKLLHFTFQKNQNAQTSVSDTLCWKASSSSLSPWTSWSCIGRKKLHCVNV